MPNRARSIVFPDDAIRGIRTLIQNIMKTNPEQAKALLKLLIESISVDARSAIKCTYRLPGNDAEEAVRATSGEVGPPGLGPGLPIMSRLLTGLSYGPPLDHAVLRPRPGPRTACEATHWATGGV